jgi:hypothetical protein
MNGLLEQLRTLATSGTRVAGILETPSQLVCGAMIDGTTFDVGTSRLLTSNFVYILLCVEGATSNGVCSGKLASVVSILTNVLGT